MFLKMIFSLTLSARNIHLSSTYVHIGFQFHPICIVMVLMKGVCS